jgi:hypothetical protein
MFAQLGFLDPSGESRILPFGPSIQNSIEMSEPNTLHYHIRWSGESPLNLQSLATAEEAHSAAKQIVRSGESYSIEKFDGDCIQCRQAFKDLLHRNAQR